MEFNPPLRERDDLELIAIAFSNTDYWQQEAIDQAKKELENRGISKEFQLSVIKKWEEAEEKEQILYQEQLKKNAIEKYDFAEKLYILILSPLILTGRIYSTSRLTLTELNRENFKIKFRQRILLLILGIGLWIGSFYCLGYILIRVNTNNAEKANIHVWEKNRISNDSIKK